MTKGYVKENGTWRLTDKDPTQTQVIINEQRPLSLEELGARLKRLESIVIDPRK